MKGLLRMLSRAGTGHDAGPGITNPAPGTSAVPNDALRMARLRRMSPSGSGRELSRAELAGLVSQLLPHAVSAHYIGRLERGEFRWPGARTRHAFRQVLNAQTDADLGFYIVRPQPTVDRSPLGTARLAWLDDPPDVVDVGEPGTVQLRLGA